MNIRSIFNSLINMQNSYVIEELLKGENIPIESLLDNNEELIQELKNRNINLLKYFDANETSKIVKYLITEPETDEYKRCYKYPFICNEIISCEVSEILDNFFQETGLLNQLFSFLDFDLMNLTLSGYFTNTVEILLKHNSYELLSYIYEQTDAGKKLPKHLYSSSIMNLLFKLLSCEDHGNPAYNSELYEMVDIIMLNFSLNIENTKDSIKLINSANLLYSLLTNHIEVFNWSDVELQLSGPPNIDILFKNSIERNELISSNALLIITGLIKNLDIRYNEDNSVINEVPLVLEYLCQNIPTYKDLLIENLPLLGLSRLRIVELISASLKIIHPCIVNSIKEHCLVSVFIVRNIQELFNKYP